MAIVIRPKLGLTLQARNDKAQKFEHWIYGDTNEANILSAYASYLPVTFNIFKYLKDYYIEEQEPGIWIGTAEYELIRENDPGEEDPAQIPVEFEIGGENVKLTHSLETRDSQLSDDLVFDAPPDFFGGVNVTSSGIEGYDFEVPTLKWSETYFMPKALIYGGYLLVLREIKGFTNASAFRGFDIDEVYFAGATGRTSDKFFDYYEMNFKFVADKNLTGLTHPNFTTGIDKKAHDILWFYNVEQEDDMSKTTQKIPVARYVERIREQVDFSILQLPV